MNAIRACRPIWLLIVPSAVFCASCDQGAPPVGDCCTGDAGLYPDQICVYSSCETRCSQDADAGESPCAQGHPCVLNLVVDDYICDPLCHDDDCPSRQECDATDGVCFAPDHCGDYVPCLDSSKICDAPLDKCFPRNGDCSSGQGCPYFSTGVQSVAVISCDGTSQVCRAERRIGASEWFAEGTSGSIPIHSPDPVAGTTFASGNDVQFSWDPQPSSVLLRAFDRMPIDNASFEDGLIWGASVPEDGPHSLAWSQGSRYSDGDWDEGAAAPLAAGVYYFAVIAVAGGEKKRVSAFVPFAVGASSAFDQIGSPCSKEGTPGDCASLSQPLTCYQGICRRLCASHLDCEPANCQDPQGGRRFCAM